LTRARPPPPLHAGAVNQFCTDSGTSLMCAGYKCIEKQQQCA
jgi:hypothetical protein